MDERLARIVAIAAVQSARELGDLAPLLKQHATGGLYDRMKGGIGEAVYAIHESILEPILAAFPALREEFDGNLERFGRFC